MSHSQLDQHLDALGAQLATGARLLQHRRRRVRRTAAVVGVSGGIVCAALGVVPTTRTDAVAEAKAVMINGNGIIHYQVRSQHLLEKRPGTLVASGPLPDGIRTEVWAALGSRPASRWRWTDRPRREGCTPTPVHTTRGWLLFGRSTEARRAGDLHQFYSSDARLLLNDRITNDERRRSAKAADRVRGGEPIEATDAVLWGDAGDVVDPSALVGEMLAEGRLRDGGIVNRDGQRVRRLIGTIGVARRVSSAGTRIDPQTGRFLGASAGSSWWRQPDELTYLVDADTYEPIELRRRSQVVWSHAGGRLHIKWQHHVLTFAEFERLPDTPEQRAESLTLRVPAGTRVAWQLDEQPVLRWGADARRQVSRLVRTEGQAIRARCLAAARR